MRKLTKQLTLITAALLLSSCSALFDKDNMPQPKPLVDFKPEVKPHLIWTTKAGSGVGGDYLKMGPVINGENIYTTSTNGTVTSVNKNNGHVNWQTGTALQATTPPGVGDGIVVVGGSRGDVIALRQADGAILWKSSIPGELLAAPAVSNGRVVVKAVDGYVRALSVANGQQAWVFQQTEPALILRGSSAPLIRDRYVIAGFANGNLAKLSLNDGQLFWMQTIAIPEGAFSIQRMIDIDADPVVYGHRIFAATYQGKIDSVEWSSGRILWSHDISSYTGMIADDNTVYVSDAKSAVWAFGADSGLVNWRQTELEARIVTTPASMGNYVVVGDAQGFLHWLSKRDGHFAAREFAGSAIYAAPLVDHNVLYALTNKGYLVAYTLGG
jgi:outer membrane protein assembly factor BamB